MDHTNDAPPSQPTSAEALANAIRPRIFFAGNEYLAEPDIQQAALLLTNPTPADTDGSPGTRLAPSTPTADTSSSVDVRKSAYIIGNDDRTRVLCDRYVFPARTKGKYTSSSGSCSATLIGPHTIAIAAHCLYNNGWFPLGNFVPGTDTTEQPSCPLAQPYGSFAPSWLAVPGGWNSDEWDYDYAEMELPESDTGIGWMGTTYISGFANVTTLFQDYPGDKPSPQYWQQTGTITIQSPPPNNDVNRIPHNFDIINGASGGGFIRTSDDRLFGIQSTSDSQFGLLGWQYWNTASAWTSTVYNFFHAAGTWP